jgi:HEPN domain-containing protein
MREIAMKPIVNEWVAKAEEDFHSALHLFRARPRISSGSACFHAYECADKYFKAILVTLVVRFHFTLPLAESYARLVKRSPEWEEFRTAAEFLSQFDDSILYPGRRATRPEARAAFAHCRAIRERAREPGPGCRRKARGSGPRSSAERRAS